MMTTPEVVRCYDGHFRCAIYGIGPYIADYQEQVLVAAIVQGWCAKYISFVNCFEKADVVFVDAQLILRIWMTVVTLELASTVL